MKATDTQLLKFLKEAEQFSVPIFQRMYSWTEEECSRLWDDILRAGSDDNVESHFLGSIVYIDGSQFQIIDGQQRLATLILLIEALARSVGSEEPLSGFSARELREDYLLNTASGRNRRYKLLLTQTDRLTLMALVDEMKLPDKCSLHLKGNFDFFMKQLSSLNGDYEAVCLGLTKLVIVDIALTHGDDNPQLIYESMNSTGLDLSEADLIRNFVLMGLEEDQQDLLYKHYWRSMEEEFGQEAYERDFNHFMRYYLTVKNRNLPKVREVYREFQIFAQKYTSEYEIEDLMIDICKYAKHYCAFALGKENEPKLSLAFEDLRQLRANVSYPLLLEFYDDYIDGLIDLEELLKLVRLIECYVFRRAVCGIPTNSLNNTFASFAKNIDKANYVQSVEVNFISLQYYRQLPVDEEFFDSLIKRDVYNFQRCAYLLRKLENNERKEPVPVNEYTIEHIMPQNENLSVEWKSSLGSEWQRIHSEYLHTLGNLTLTGYNSEYSDKPFSEKRDMEGGFSKSPLTLNSDVGSMSDWNEATIINRADRLGKIALKVWSYPTLSTENENIYTPTKSEEREKYSYSFQKSTEYSLSDHPLIDEGGNWHELYTAILEEIMNLDSCVSEKFVKLYATYSAKQIFAMLQPDTSGLLICLYMPYAELHDPKEITLQIPSNYNRGRREAELLLSEPDEIPYVMSLVRQAFRHQMDNED